MKTVQKKKEQDAKRCLSQALDSGLLNHPDVEQGFCQTESNQICSVAL